MTKNLFDLTVFFAFVLALAPPKVHADSPLKIALDKGTLEIRYAPMEKKYTYEVQKNPRCLAKIELKETGDKILLAHSSETCLSGHKILLTLNERLSAEVSLDAGVLEIKHPARTIQKLGRLKAEVDAGVIETELQGLKAKRTDDYAGATLAYQTPGGTTLPTLALQVKAGVIEL